MSNENTETTATETTDTRAAAIADLRKFIEEFKANPFDTVSML